MNLSVGVMGSMCLPGSSLAGKSAGPGAGAGVVSDQFPAGLRVLVVDDDRTCLTILEKMLGACRYEVTKTNRAEDALYKLRENRNGFDIVISDVHMPDMDGFKLLECVGLEMDLPVIMMSADDSKNVVMKGVTHGACDYLIKPVRIEALKNIWQHVVRKKKNELKEIEQSGSWEEGDRPQKQDDTEQSSPLNEGNWKSSKRKGEDDDTEERDDTGAMKKPRVVWSVELHQQFVGAVNQLGIDKAVPKKILELMNVPGLTRENVASHLQKYRLYLRRLSGVPQHPGGLNNSFMGPQDPSFGTMSSLTGIDIQTLAATGQLPAQALAAYQGALSRPPIKPAMMPFFDQRNLFSFDNSKIRYGDAQLQDQLGNSKQLNMLHGIPTTMELKQLAGLHQPKLPSASTCHLGSSSVAHMVQTQQSRGQMLNESIGNQISRVQSSVQQPLASNGAPGGIMSRPSAMAENGQGMAYNPVSQTSSVVDFSVNRVSDLSGNGFPLGSTPGITSLATKGFNLGVNPGVKGPRSLPPSYDIFSELQQKPQDWQLQNASGLTFSAAPQPSVSVQSNVNVSPSVLVDHSYSSSSCQKNKQSVNSIAGKPMFEHQHGSIQNVNQNLDAIVFGNTSRVKTESVTDGTGGANIFSEQFGQDDLMSALLKQQDVIVPGEFDFDLYNLDSFPHMESLPAP